ncbi:hypothetical protein PJL18_03760 [Paenarthrobacter nicotinovorans]|nr:hypothetical protein [Paenarthrobacter nicotinovorans]
MDRPGKADEVAAAVPEYLFDNGRRVQAAGHAQRKTKLPVRLGIACQDSRLPLPGLHDPFTGLIAPGGDVQKVQMLQVGLGDDGHLLFGGDAVCRSLHDGDAHAHHSVRDGCPHGVDDEVHEPFRSRELVRAVVGQRGHELVDQVAVGAVDVDHVEACGHRPACGLRVGFHQLMAVLDSEFTGNLATCNFARYR